ncbi:hypothetical protein NP233_g12482 [Leucocoprinus birnbaumii]|uniref:PHD-type domain-containing protein n=1 Tax=Leucocoprinus birnbaumii TaxID=56174 RepID=A0AAD5VEC6_9AGAR|nr:hypothetical protein NP233_g12482 [Leucocoprinus birnbaumii]
MHGLAFPSPPNSALTPEVPETILSPATTSDDIPIDPALGGGPPPPPVADVHQPQEVQVQATPDQQWTHDRLPEGDPFAPQNTTPFLPAIIPPPQHPPHPLKPVKKKRRVERCSICGGTDAKNSAGVPEPMITCNECGRIDHPSCMKLDEIGDMIRSYPWKCLECKNCELCGEKGDDVSVSLALSAFGISGSDYVKSNILFCDRCDRGWHGNCMQPPIDVIPEGEWYCPPCQETLAAVSPTPFPPEMLVDEAPIPQSDRESSAASIPPTPRSRGRPKRKPLPVEVEEELDAEGEVDDEPPPPTPAPKARTRGSATKKRGRRSRQRQVQEEQVEEEVEVEEEEEEVDETPIPLPRSSRKRRRELESSPVPIPRVRLRLPTTRNSAKGKEKEEEEAGMFDGILGVEDRDTSKTTITNHDKQLFERSRAEAEKKLAPPAAFCDKHDLQPPVFAFL